ncbi:hypothetical protein FOMA001_g17638 [Fusarium oxysporum f. sp. matthiolae]|nr:hypothetical protein FOMA001_g17638 [Fusarium oxysporum f. sp. matthiolae]
MTIARKLRIQGNLPQKLWPYIVAHATRLLNRIPVQRKQWRTPFEMVHGRKPNLSHLKIIGSLAYVLIKNKKARPARAKLQENALTGWLVGFDATNIHKVWIPHLDRVIVSRDVQIDEKVMYDPQLATTLPESGQALAITVNEVDLDEEDVEPLPITEDIATSVPVSIQTEVEPPPLGLLLTPQSSPERATAGEIQVEQPDVLRPPESSSSPSSIIASSDKYVRRRGTQKGRYNGRRGAPEPSDNFWEKHQTVSERSGCNRNTQTALHPTSSSEASTKTGIRSTTGTREAGTSDRPRLRICTVNPNPSEGPATTT